MSPAGSVKVSAANETLVPATASTAEAMTGNRVRASFMIISSGSLFFQQCHIGDGCRLENSFLPRAVHLQAQSVSHRGRACRDPGNPDRFPPPALIIMTGNIIF